MFMRRCSLAVLASICALGAALPAHALNDSFTTPYNTIGTIAYDGGDRLLVVWLGRTSEGDQLVGQIFSASTGAPLSPSRIYASKPTGRPRAAFGGGRFLVTYTSVWSSSDHDIAALFVKTDGTKDGAFLYVDAASRMDYLGDVTYVAERNEFYVVYNGGPGFSSSYDSRGSYVTQSGNVTGRGMLAAGRQAESVSYGPGNILVAFRDNSAVYRGHLAPGESTIRELIRIASGEGPQTAYSAPLGRFAVTFRTYTKAWAQTLSGACLTSSCGGASAVTTTFSNAQIGSTNVNVPAVAPAGSNFVMAAGALFPGYKGISTASMNGDAFVHTRHVSQWDAPCNNEYFPHAFDSESLGSTAVYLIQSNCSGAAPLEGLILNTWSGRTNTPFRIAD